MRDRSKHPNNGRRGHPWMRRSGDETIDAVSGKENQKGRESRAVHERIQEHPESALKMTKWGNRMWSSFHIYIYIYPRKHQHKLFIVRFLYRFMYVLQYGSTTRANLTNTVAASVNQLIPFVFNMNIPTSVRSTLYNPWLFVFLTRSLLGHVGSYSLNSIGRVFTNSTQYIWVFIKKQTWHTFGRHGFKTAFSRNPISVSDLLV